MKVYEVEATITLTYIWELDAPSVGQANKLAADEMRKMLANIKKDDALDSTDISIDSVQESEGY